MAVPEFDVAVIGGGVAGMSVAGEIGRSLRVVVLEQEAQLAFHASGRSAAAFLESYGSPEIRTLTRASRPLFDSDVPVEPRPDGDVSVEPRPDGAPAPLLSPRRLLWIASSGGVAHLSELLATEPVLREVSVAEAREYCPGLRAEWVAAAAAEDGAQDLDVAGLFDRYRRMAIGNGVTIRLNAGVRAARRSAEGWQLSTGAEELRARVVVDAAGAWADQVASRAGVMPVGLTPMRRTVAIVSCPTVSRTWPLVCDIDDAFYLRPEGDALLLSPADETPSEPVDARADPLDIALALERANEATTLELRHVRRSWAGLRTFAPDRNPVVGFDPEHPGFFWLAGQGGYGMQTAPAMARLAATLICGGAVTAELRPVAERLSPARLR